MNSLRKILGTFLVSLGRKIKGKNKCRIYSDCDGNDCVFHAPMYKSDVMKVVDSVKQQMKAGEDYRKLSEEDLRVVNTLLETK